MHELLEPAILVAMFASTVRIATPLLLSSIGELVVQRAGIWNLGIEGGMLMAAFVAYMVTISTGSPWAGLGAAILAGVAMNIIMAICAVTLKLNQFIIGLGMNLFAAGTTLFLYRQAAAAAGGETLPSVPTFSNLHLPVLSDLSVIGPALFSQQPLTYFAFAMVPVIWFFLYRTRYGLEIRSLGENPKALDTKGLSVARRQYAALVFGGIMTGLAGAFLVLMLTGRFVPAITSGRGWLAFVIIIAGRWRPWAILVAVLFFAALEAFQLQAQGIGAAIPYQLLLALPYLLAIVAMMIAKNSNAAQPERLGVPYTRE